MESRSTLLEPMEQMKRPSKEWGSSSQLRISRSPWLFTFILRCTLGTSPMITKIWRTIKTNLIFCLTTTWISRGSKCFWTKTSTLCFSVLRTEKASVMNPRLSRPMDSEWSLAQHKVARVAATSQFAAEEDGKGAQMKTWFSMEPYDLWVNVNRRSRENNSALEQWAEKTKQVNRHYEVGLP